MIHEVGGVACIWPQAPLGGGLGRGAGCGGTRFLLSPLLLLVWHLTIVPFFPTQQVSAQSLLSRLRTIPLASTLASCFKTDLVTYYTVRVLSLSGPDGALVKAVLLASHTG